MNIRHCAREQEVKEALSAGHWPEACDPTLREHVTSCERCGELVLLTQAFQSSRAEAMAIGDLPHPGILWWRAQLRRRNEALERMSQPTRWVGGFALLCTVVVIIGSLAWQRQYLAEWVSWFGGLSRSSSMRLDSLWGASSSWSLWLMLSCLMSLCVFAVVALYVVKDTLEQK